MVSFVYLVLTPVSLTFGAYQAGLTLLAVIHCWDFCQNIPDFVQLATGCACTVLHSVLVCLFETAEINKSGLESEQINAKISQFPAV